METVTSHVILFFKGDKFKICNVGKAPYYVTILPMHQIKYIYDACLGDLLICTGDKEIISENPGDLAYM